MRGELGASPPRQGSPGRVSPHRGVEARERALLLQRKSTDTSPLPAALQRPRYVPSPTHAGGAFYFEERKRNTSKRRERASRSPVNGQSIRHTTPEHHLATDEYTTHSVATSAATPELPPPPVLAGNVVGGLLSHAADDPLFAGEGLVSSPPQLQHQPHHEHAIPIHPHHPGTPPTRTLSPSRRASPIHNASAYISATSPSPSRVAHNGCSPRSHTPISKPPSLDPYTPPQEEELVCTSENRHLVGRGSQSERTATQWAGSLRGQSPVRVSVKGASFSRSTDGHGMLGAMQGTPLRVTVSAQDKWRRVPAQQWAVPPSERLSTFVKRCGLTEPEVPHLDKAFLGYSVHVVNKDIRWQSSSSEDMSVKALGLRSGDTVEVSTSWATYRGQ